MLIQCGNDFDECFTVVDLQKEDSPLVYINSRFTQVTGYTKAESIGRNCRFLQGPKSDSSTTSLLKKAISHESCCWFDLINYKKDGTLFWNRLMLIPIEDDFHGIRYFVGIQSDVTKTKELTKKEKILDFIGSDKATNEIEHNVANPLQEIISNIRSLQYLDDDKKVVDEIKFKIKEIVSYVRSL